MHADYHAIVTVDQKGVLSEPMRSHQRRDCARYVLTHQQFQSGLVHDM